MNQSVAKDLLEEILFGATQASKTPRTETDTKRLVASSTPGTTHIQPSVSSIVVTPEYTDSLQLSEEIIVVFTVLYYGKM